MRDYVVGSGKSAIIIHKVSQTDWRIRPATYHSAFYFERHSLLRNARRVAELLWRGKREWDLVLDLPACQDRRKKH